MIEYRKYGLNKIYELLPHDMGKVLEKSIYFYASEFQRIKKMDESCLEQIYNHKLEDIYYNLVPENNQYLLLQIISNEIQVEKVPYLTPHELDPNKWKTILDRRAYYEMKKNDCEESVYECKKCKTKKLKMQSNLK